MVQVRVPDKLIADIRPFVETEWEKKCREDGLPTPGDAEITARALQDYYAIKARPPKPKDPYYS